MKRLRLQCDILRFEMCGVTDAGDDDALVGLARVQRNVCGFNRRFAGSVRSGEMEGGQGGRKSPKITSFQRSLIGINSLIIVGRNVKIKNHVISFV